MGYHMEYVLTFVSMIIHELGHIVAALVLGKRVYGMRILPVGINASIDEYSCTRPEKIIIYICGPISNLLLAVIFLNLWFGFSIKADKIFFLIIANAFLAVFNLLPALPFDGGRILREILAARYGLISANKSMLRLTATVSLLLVLLGMVQFLRNFINFSFILIGLYIFFLLKNEKTEAAMMNVKDMIYRRSRLLKKGVYPARDLVVVKTMHLGDIIKCLDFDRFHIIHVLNENLKLLKVYTEQDIIDGVFKYSADMTFEEFMEKNV
jgi:stage IV sporulation protein FB